jgi:hypothetical protein
MRDCSEPIAVEPPVTVSAFIGGPAAVVEDAEVDVCPGEKRPWSALGAEVSPASKVVTGSGMVLSISALVVTSQT